MAYRSVPPAAAMMGQAAVQCLRSGQQADNLETDMLVETLRKHGAYLPQKETCKTMTRS